jgi:hypothetical protein
MEALSAIMATVPPRLAKARTEADHCQSRLLAPGRCGPISRVNQKILLLLLYCHKDQKAGRRRRLRSGRL